MARDWLTRLKSIFAREQAGGVMVSVNEARDECLRDVLLTLSPPHDVKIFVGVEQLIEANENDLAIFLPKRGETTWLNINRPFFSDKKLRLILWLSQEHTIHLQKNAPDFFDWISHHLDCPKEAPPTPEQVEESRLEELFLARVWDVSFNPKLFRAKPSFEEANQIAQSLFPQTTPQDKQRIARLVALTRLKLTELVRLLSLLQPQWMRLADLNEAEEELKREPTLARFFDRRGWREQPELLFLPLHKTRNPKGAQPEVGKNFPLIKSAGSFASLYQQSEVFAASLGPEHPDTIAAKRELDRVVNSLPTLVEYRLMLGVPSKMLQGLALFIKHQVDTRAASTTTDGATIFWSPEDLIRGQAHFATIFHHHLLHAVLLHPTKNKHSEKTWRQATEQVVQETLDNLSRLDEVRSVEKLSTQSAEEIYASLTRVETTGAETTCLRVPDDPEALRSFWEEKQRFAMRLVDEEPFNEWIPLATKIVNGEERKTKLPEDVGALHSLLHSVGVMPTSAEQGIRAMEWFADNAPLSKTLFVLGRLLEGNRRRSLGIKFALAVLTSPKVNKLTAEFDGYSERMRN